ncbi:WXG100 family type VII secretion target [Knoellia remsis]|uniref:WXG100 family type VII secretion target n=1 Tax=Knoellia remsis TaxID=407159 RepID=A0A2T0UEN1_9MICO|nr:WXG100 family type VII secretion target [Knoellia remsis]PRY56308.1 WXG100 family type VII secretion target [Knoellia remsis]
MSGQNIKVGSGGLDILIADMQRGVNDLRGKVEDMEGNLKPHMGAWEAGAKLAFEDTKRKWNTEVNDLNELLLDIKKAVEQSKEAYLAGELRNKNSWGS